MSDVSKTEVPAIRFPEFKSELGWQLTTIGDIGSFYYGKSAPKWSLEKHAPTPCVRYGELYTKFGAVITETYSRTNIDIANLRFSKGGEVLVPRVGEKPEDFGKCCSYLPLKDIAIGEMISVFETEQNPLFYTYYFRNMYKDFAKVVEGQNVKNLYYNQLEPLPIYRPPNPKEQQKIADCLSSLDDLITAQNKKIEALKQHKKSLMQQLFPAEGETVPQLRFPEFENDGEWLDTNFYDLLDEVFDFRGRTPLKIGMDWGGGDVISLSANNVKNGFIDFTAECNLGSEELYNKWMGKVNLEKGDIVFTMEAPLGKALLIPDSRKYILSQRVVAFKTKEHVNNSFLLQLIWSDSFQNRINQLATGSTAKGINQKTLKKVNIKIAKSSKEQQKIAISLSSLDELISIQIKKLKALKEHKRGLMQQLFPSLDEA